MNTSINDERSPSTAAPRTHEPPRPFLMAWLWQTILLLGASGTRVAASLALWAVPVYAYSRYVRLILSHFAPG